jgi:CRISPR system Cascade subunit CasC
MTKFLQLHLLTAYPPANLNRDDSGTPKTAIFGGVQRLRVSSQSLKRAWRTSEVFEQALGAKSGLGDHLAKRTQRAGVILRDVLLAGGKSEMEATNIARSFAALIGKPLPEEKAKESDGSVNQEKLTYTGQLVFLSSTELEKIRDFGTKILGDEKLAQQLASTAGETEADEANEEESDDAGKQKGKSKKKKGLPKLLVQQLRSEVLQASDTAVDLAMFGRMMADSPAYNYEAAVQVAHAITTHRVAIEDDYYVAVDDLKDANTREDAGTSFIGVQEFGSGIFYIYICVDMALLVRNLGDDKGLARDAIDALICAAATVAPKGKQASFASRACASFVMAELGTQQPRTLATAFLNPIRAGSNDQEAESVEKLKAQFAKFSTAYGNNGTTHIAMDTTGKNTTGTLAEVVAFARDGIE